MKKHAIATVALAVALSQPAAAITFPSFTTIYVGSGVRDDQGTNTIATAFICTNVSGVTASLRILLLSDNGAVAQTGSVLSFNHGATHTYVTNPIASFPHNSNFAASAIRGAVNIELTQSAVFCNALIMHRVNVSEGIPLLLVRVNPHPGTVE